MQQRMVTRPHPPHLHPRSLRASNITANFNEATGVISSHQHEGLGTRENLQEKPLTLIAVGALPLLGRVIVVVVVQLLTRQARKTAQESEHRQAERGHAARGPRGGSNSSLYDAAHILVFRLLLLLHT